MTKIPLEMKLGLASNGLESQASNINRWRDGNYVRFEDGQVTTIGGYRELKLKYPLQETDLEWHRIYTEDDWDGIDSTAGVNCLLVHNNKLYIGTEYEGLSVATISGGELIFNNRYTSDDGGLKSNDVDCLLEVDNVLYIGTSRGLTVATFDGDELVFWDTYQRGHHDLPSSTIYSLASKDDKLYLGTSRGLTVATISGTTLSIGDTYIDEWIRSLTVHNDILFAGTYGDGLFVMKIVDNGLIREKQYTKEDNGFSGNNIRCLLTDTNKLLVGTREGLTVATIDGYELSDIKTYKDDDHDLLPSGTILSLFKEGDDIYIGGFSGLSIASLKDDELLFKKHHDISFVKVLATNGEKLYVGTGNDLQIMNIVEIEETVPREPYRGIHLFTGSNNMRWLAIGGYQHLIIVSMDQYWTDITPANLVINADGSKNSILSGFGILPFGTSPFGGGATLNEGVGEDDLPIARATEWTLDNFGQDLIGISSSDGDLIIFKTKGVALSSLKDDTVKAIKVKDDTTLSDANRASIPINNKGLVVTSERMIMIYGANGNSKEIAWSTRESYGDFKPTEYNIAGTHTLVTEGSIESAINFRGEILFFTTVDLHTARYLKYPYGYGFEFKGDGCGILSTRAVAVTPKAVYWMSQGRFYFYNGYVQNLECPIVNDVFRSLDGTNKNLVHAVHNSKFQEIWWFYVSHDSVDRECDSYVAYNYEEGNWMKGKLRRTSGMDRGTFQLPVMVAPDGVIYEHEDKETSLSSSLKDEYGQSYKFNDIFIESNDIAIFEEPHVLAVNMIELDSNQDGQTDLEILTRNTLEGDSVRHSLEPASDNKFYTRFGGKYFKIRANCKNPDNWKVGKFLFDVRKLGQK